MQNYPSKVEEQNVKKYYGHKKLFIRVKEKILKEE